MVLLLLGHTNTQLLILATSIHGESQYELPKHVILAANEKPNATKGDQSVLTAKKTISNVRIGKSLHKSRRSM